MSGEREIFSVHYALLDTSHQSRNRATSRAVSHTECAANSDLFKQVFLLRAMLFSAAYCKAVVRRAMFAANLVVDGHSIHVTISPVSRSKGRRTYTRMGYGALWMSSAHE